MLGDHSSRDSLLPVAGAGLKGLKKATAAHSSQEQGWERNSACGPGPEEGGKAILMRCFFPLEPGREASGFHCFLQSQKAERKPWVRSEGHVVGGFFSLVGFIFGCVVGTDESSRRGGTLLAALRSYLRFGLQRGDNLKDAKVESTLAGCSHSRGYLF